MFIPSCYLTTSYPPKFPITFLRLHQISLVPVQLLLIQKFARKSTPSSSFFLKLKCRFDMKSLILHLILSSRAYNMLIPSALLSPCLQIRRCTTFLLIIVPDSRLVCYIICICTSIILQIN